MAPKQTVAKATVARESDGRFWQPDRERRTITDAAKRWREENADAAKAWNEWVEKNGLPLADLREF